MEQGSRHLVEPFGAFAQCEGFRALGLHALAVVEGKQLVVPLPRVLVNPGRESKGWQESLRHRIIGGKLSRVAFVVDKGAHVGGLKCYIIIQVGTERKIRMVGIHL